MGGLGPADAAGNYTRPSSDPLSPPALNPENLLQRSADQRPILVIGRSCPWAHRTWLVHQLRHLHDSLTLVMARADHDAGRWALCILYTSPSPRDKRQSRMPSSA